MIYAHTRPAPPGWTTCPDLQGIETALRGVGTATGGGCRLGVHLGGGAVLLGPRCARADARGEKRGEERDTDGIGRVGG